MRLVPPAFAAAAALWLGSPASAQDAEAGGRKAAVCTACHGPGGNSAQPLYPSLAGQTARYVYLQLKDFKEGRRTDTLMTPMAQNLTRDDMLDLAAFFAAQELRPAAFKTDPPRVAQGAAKAAETLCTMCHLGGFKGQNEIPRVAGQQHDYIVKQLQDFKAGRRKNDAGSMTSVSKTLSDDDIENLAQYLTTLY
ncbi:MAG: cytochrome c4 [Gemmatimonadales bacterium]|nr:cytochrome c4 [Gemmatimonadales bacterium]